MNRLYVGYFVSLLMLTIGLLLEVLRKKGELGFPLFSSQLMTWLILFTLTLLMLIPLVFENENKTKLPVKVARVLNRFYFILIIGRIFSVVVMAFIFLGVFIK